MKCARMLLRNSSLLQQRMGVKPPMISRIGSHSKRYRFVTFHRCGDLGWGLGALYFYLSYSSTGPSDPKPNPNAITLQIPVGDGSFVSTEGIMENETFTSSPQQGSKGDEPVIEYSGKIYHNKPHSLRGTLIVFETLTIRGKFCEGFLDGDGRIARWDKDTQSYRLAVSGYFHKGKLRDGYIFNKDGRVTGIVKNSDVYECGDYNTRFDRSDLRVEDNTEVLEAELSRRFHDGDLSSSMVRTPTLEERNFPKPNAVHSLWYIPGNKDNAVQESLKRQALFDLYHKAIFMNGANELHYCAVHDPATTKKILRMKIFTKHDLNKGSQLDSSTPLFDAVRCGRFDLMELLVAHGAEATTREFKAILEKIKEQEEKPKMELKQ